MRRIAILGAGIGAQHLDALLDLPGWEVAWLCDLDRARAEAVAAGRVPVTDDPEAVLADPSVAVVDICLPPHLHFDWAVRALETGRHVVCEKPLVPSLAEADALLATAARTGRRLFPVFQYRYGPAMDRLRALMGAGLTGRAYAAALETHWDRRADYYAVPWRGTWVGENGGAVLGHAIHNHDLLTTILGPVAAVQASVATRVNAIETEDCAAVALTLASGALATSSITLGAATDETRLRIAFERLTVESGTVPYAPAEGDWRFTARDRADQARVDAVLAGVRPGPSGYRGFFDAVGRALDGRGDAVTAEDGRASIALVAAIYASARSGRRVAVGDEGALYRGWRPGEGA